MARDDSPLRFSSPAQTYVALLAAGLLAGVVIGRTWRAAPPAAPPHEAVSGDREELPRASSPTRTVAPVAAFRHVPATRSGSVAPTSAPRTVAEPPPLPAPRAAAAHDEHPPATLALAPDPPAPARSEPARPVEDPARERPADADGSIAGWVRDEAGIGLPSLRVTARLRRPLRGQPAGATARSAATDQDGRFVLSGLAGGEYEVAAGGDGLYQRTTAQLRAGVDSAVLVVREVDGRSVLVSGLVESARGGPLAGVRVAARHGGNAVSDEAGSYALRVAPRGRGGEQLSFELEGYRDGRAELSAEDLERDQVRLDARLDPVQAGAVVDGRVSARGGGPVARAPVQLTSVSLGRRYDALSDAAGRFSFDAVEPGDYRLWVRPQALYRPQGRDVTVAAGGAHVAVALEPLETATLSARLLDPEGRPVPGYALWVASGQPSSGPRQVVSDAGGRIVAEDLPEGRLALQTHAAPLLSVSGIDLDAAAPREIRVLLDVGDHRLEGNVVDAQGDPLPGAQVALDWVHQEGPLRSSSRRQTVSDAGGHFLFTQLGAGPHSVRVTADGHRPVRLESRVGDGGDPLVVALEGASW